MCWPVSRAGRDGGGAQHDATLRGARSLCRIWVQRRSPRPLTTAARAAAEDRRLTPEVLDRALQALEGRAQPRDVVQVRPAGRCRLGLRARCGSVRLRFGRSLRKSHDRSKVALQGIVLSKHVAPQVMSMV